jgi:UTP-glucose-1-phosphate uridylyltransferase
MKPTLLILAAGMGSRYGGLKQMDKVGPSGETIIDYSIYDAIRAGFGKVVFVIRREIEEEFKEVFIDRLKGKIDIDYVFQELTMVPNGITVPENRKKPWGTGHAIMVAEEKINEPFAVINADDFYGSQSFGVIAKFLRNNQNENDYAMVGYQLDKTLSDFGHVARGVCKADENGFLQEVTERTNIQRTEKGIVFTGDNEEEVILSGNETVSMNFWGFKTSVFTWLKKYFAEFIKEYGNEPKSEFFIPILVMELIKIKQANVKVLELLIKLTKKT